MNLKFIERLANTKSMGLWDRCRHLALEKKLAAFPIHSSQVKVLREPAEFYESLLQKCQKAEKRIVIASLYLGTGPLESSLLSAISKRMQQIPTLKGHVLLDCLRGSREDINSRTMLLPLIRNQKLKVSLYHTPRYRGILRKLLSNRYNEIIGVQHMKLYLFDNDLIITGANLSNDYFTQRQDRYVVVRDCQQLGDFVTDLTSRVSDFSFQLDENNSTSLSSGWNLDPTTSCFTEYVDKVRQHITKFCHQSAEMYQPATTGKFDSVIYPMLEMGQFYIHQESDVTKRVIEQCSANEQVLIATGYFNITKDLAHSIISRSKALCYLLMAHPKANGFYNARGAAGGIPKGYSELAGRFYDEVLASHQSHRVRLSEYERDGWTFHAKGLWLQPNSSSPPVLTLIGSPNFGKKRAGEK